MLAQSPPARLAARTRRSRHRADGPSGAVFFFFERGPSGAAGGLTGLPIPSGAYKDLTSGLSFRSAQ
jgi:hypothetical protein